MSRALIEISHATIVTPTDRVLFEDLSLAVGRDRVGLIGRNGVGKSTLLSVLAGVTPHAAVRVHGLSHFVPQLLVAREGEVPLSRGQLRRLRLEEARGANAELLVLDEPSDDLDEASVAWLRGWLRAFRGGLIVATHDRRLLEDFRHFFIARENGCTLFSGTIEALLAERAREHEERDAKYASELRRLADTEEHNAYVARRKARKKQYGRCRELDRGTSRARLNLKRSEAQVSHGRLARIRDDRVATAREWSKAARRALDVRFPLTPRVPVLPSDDGRALVSLERLTAERGGRTLFRDLDLRIGRERVAIVGPNGAGKSTLLEIVRGDRAPEGGRVRVDRARLGAIAQGAADWLREESLVTELLRSNPALTHDELAKTLVAHKFPLALAERPLRFLSPGERTRAALACLFERDPACELLVLDEPTFGLDLFAIDALASVLAQWPGGLLVASHDRAFLAAAKIDRKVDLDVSVSRGWIAVPPEETSRALSHEETR